MNFVDYILGGLTVLAEIIVFLLGVYIGYGLGKSTEYQEPDRKEKKQ